MKPEIPDFLKDSPLFVSSPMPVEPAWIDYNGHMNLAYYHVLFDRCSDEVVPHLGCGPDYRARTNHTIFAGQAQVRYRRELNLGDHAVATFRLLNFDAKRVHLAHELFHTDGWLSATCEILWLHVDQSGPRVVPFPDEVLDRIAQMHRAHAAIERPDWIGKVIALPPRP